MKLWDYLKNKLTTFSYATAFPQCYTTYADIMEYQCAKKTGKIEVCDKPSKLENAKAVLRAIASGATCVPYDKDYGDGRLFGGYLTSETYLEAAFVMLTGGTTGNAKGIILSDKNVITNLEYIDGYFDVTGCKSICIMRPLSHVSALVGELLFALTKGLRIYFYEEAFVPSRLIKFLKENEIDVFCSTPTVFDALSSVQSEMPNLKVASISGERLNPFIAEKLAKKFIGTDFYNVYGLTEHSPRVSALLPKDFLKKAGSVGKPIGDVEIKIDDGELAVRSPCVMQGYVHGGVGKIKQGWLYTGDMPHIDSEGYLYIDGRKDGMINRAGVNIFPEEAEGMIKKCAQVEDVIVYETKTRGGLSVVAADYTGDISVQALRAEMERKVPAKLRPTVINKVDKIALSTALKKVRK